MALNVPETFAPPQGIRPNFGAAVVLAIIATGALAALALNDQSLWIDEIGTWRLTVADSWSDWLQQFVYWPSSDAQIPLYHLFMRAWVSVLPSTEMSLRAANFPWLFAGILALLTTRAARGARPFVLLFTGLVCLHPMVWYYADEARPYAMIIAGAMISASGLLTRLLNPGDSSVIADSNSRLIIGTALLAATSIVGLIWSTAFLMAAAATARAGGTPFPALSRQNIAVAGICALLLLPVAYQYLSSVLRGVGATALHENTLESFSSGLYEVFGLGGIGPGRDQLRSEGAVALVPYAREIFAFVLVVGAVFLAGLASSFRRDRSELLYLLAAALIPLLAFFVLGSLKHWRVLGRHMVPLLFFFSLFLALGIQALARARTAPAWQWACRAIAGAGLLALLISSVEISFAQRHRREDIRGAAAMAADALRRGESAWWVGLSYGAQYYGLPLKDPSACAAGADRSAVLFDSPRAADLEACPDPSAIILERPDTYDRAGAVRRYATEKSYAPVALLQGFEILRRTDAVHEPARDSPAPLPADGRAR
jgi:hypothetical protein